MWYSHVLSCKAAHTKELATRSNRVTQLEEVVQSMTREKDNLFDQLQMRQAELESSQSHVESVTNQCTDLQYQLREAFDRIATLNESTVNGSTLDYGISRSASNSGLDLSRASPAAQSNGASPAPADFARMLSDAESKYESRVAEMKSRLRALEKERTVEEEEWSRNLGERAKEIERMRDLLHIKEDDYREKQRSWETSEERIRQLEVIIKGLEGDKENVRKGAEIVKVELENAQEIEVRTKISQERYWD